MPPSQKVIVVLEVRASKKIDSELTKAKSKVKGWAATLSREMKNVFKRATFFRFSTIGINSFFNSIRFARQEAVAFQDALGDIVKVDISRYINLNSAATKELSENISKAANEYGILRVEAAKTLEAITVAGYRGADATKILDVALLGQSATGLKAAEIFRAILLPAMKQFKIGVNDLEGALDILVSTQANAAVGFNDFAGAFRAGGATLAGTTKSLNEAAALVAALGEVTQESGSTVGTFFKTLSPRLLANPGARRILGQYEVETANPKTGALKSMGQILTELSRNMEGVGAATKRYNLSVVSGIRQGNRLIAVLDALAKVEKLVEINSNAAGSSRRRNAIEQQKISKKWAKVQNEFVEQLQSAVLPVMDDLVIAAREIAQFGANAAVALLRVAQALGIISKKSVVEQRQVGLVGQIDKIRRELSTEALKSVDKAVAKMGYQLFAYSREEFKAGKRVTGDTFKSGATATTVMRTAQNILGKATRTSQYALASTQDIVETYDKLISAGSQFDMDAKGAILFLKNVLKAAEEQKKLDKEAGRKSFKGSVLGTDLEGVANQGSQLRSVLEKFDTSLREGAPAAAIEELRVRMTNALEAISNPAKSFNRGLLQQRKSLVEVNSVRKKTRDEALAAAEKQAETDKQGLSAAAARTIQTELQTAKDKVRVAELKDQVALAEFDAKAMRRLNTELTSMKDKSKNAASTLNTSSRRLNELRIEEAKAATAVARATISMKDALIEYEIGLIRAAFESKKITGEVGGLAQELAASKQVIPAFLNSLTKELQQPSRVGTAFGGSSIIKDELKLSSLRRESLREQLDLTRQILDRQREIGASFFGLEAGGRNELVQGLGAIQDLFGRFGGDVNKFRGLSTQDLNAFGRQLLSLPDEMKNSILQATEFIPEGATVAGFTGKQIKDLIATASLGRAGGTGILDIRDLQEEAADSTLKLADLQTDALVNSMEQLRVSQQQLDQQKAQTEVARIQVEVARQQLSILTSDQNARRGTVQAEMDFLRRKNRPSGPKMGKSAVLGFGFQDRLDAFADTMVNVLDAAKESHKAGMATSATVKMMTERFTRYNIAMTSGYTSLGALNEGIVKLGQNAETTLKKLMVIDEQSARSNRGQLPQPRGSDLGAQNLGYDSRGRIQSTEGIIREGLERIYRQSMMNVLADAAQSQSNTLNERLNQLYQQSIDILDSAKTFIEQSTAPRIMQLGKGNLQTADDVRQAMPRTSVDSAAMDTLREININTKKQNDLTESFNEQIMRLKSPLSTEELTKLISTSPATKDIDIKISAENTEKIDIVGFDQLPPAILEIIRNHPEVKAAAALRQNILPVVRAIIEAGIESGVFPPSIRASLNAIHNTDIQTE